MTYNLLDEQWIPVLYRNGEYTRVGIRRAFEDAGQIRQIAASNPMDRVAVVRFLLALLYWCVGNPQANVSDDSRDSFFKNCLKKLDDNKELFSLLGEGRRFYQYRKHGSVKDKRLSANYLVQEVPTGTNKWHFRHSTDGANGLCPACCALGLLRLPLFATSGGRGKPPGINSKPPLYIIPVGTSLAATVLLSWQPVSNLGTPAWEEPNPQLPRTGEVPLLMGLTWLPRRVWLDSPEEYESVCISCGCMAHLIRRSVFAPIGSTRTEEGGPGRIWHDPHVLYSSSPKGALHAGDVLGAADAAAGHWTKIIGGMLQSGMTGSSPVKVWVVGFSTVQNDKYLEATERIVTLPAAPRPISETVEQIGRWEKEISHIARRVRPPNEKMSSRKHIEIPPMVAAVRPNVEGSVSAKAGELLTGGQAEWERAAAAYRPMMEAIAKSLAPGFTTEAVQRRKQIGSAIPDMRP